MALTAGHRLGPYEIVSPIGAGGMGGGIPGPRHEARARRRALKVLPDSLAHDPERLARFEREAHLLAALNHPHIAHIHGFEDSTRTPALVMELKVLDFDLAKAFDPSASSAGGATMSPTLSIHATPAGIILGTAAYMAPEQARGKSVDKRADIWAFGCVLFEMLTGRRAFDGDDISTTLAAVIRADPEWSVLPPATPPSLRRLLGRCLRKVPKDRLQAIGDARVELGDLLNGHSEDAALLTITLGGATVRGRLRAFAAGPFWRSS